MNLLVLHGHMDLFAISVLRGRGISAFLLTLCLYYTVEPNPKLQGPGQRGVLTGGVLC